MSSDHIKIPDIEPITRFVADGSQVSFPFLFPIFASEDIDVFINGAQQFAGYTITGAGQTEGGAVVFDSAPADEAIVTVERRLPLERLTDFLEGGDFSAHAINTELDFLIAAIQQVNSDQTGMIRYSADEAPSGVDLPAKAQRAGKVLGFDSAGNPIAVSAEGTMTAPDYTVSGSGAVTRSTSDKFSDIISVKDFGAVGDGLIDDTLAIQQALSAHDHVFVPSGTYLITTTITLTRGKSLFGEGSAAILKGQSNSFNLIEITEGFATLSRLSIQGGDCAVKLYGRDSECVQNAVSDLHISGSNIGIMLDGYTNTARPCYWNNFDRILIEKPATHGVYLTLSGAGDTPNANRFHKIRVFSKGTSTTGSGIFVEHGKLNNSFIDCEANMEASADSCIRLGSGSDKTLLLNILTEAPSGSLIPNIKLDNGSAESGIMNLSSLSDGAAILDNSGGAYDAVNGGYPDKNRLRKSTVTDLKATLMRYDTEYIDTAGTVSLDLSHSVHIVDATNGAITIELPAASECAGVVMTVKKKDGTSNIITIDEAGSGSGPDGKTLQLGGEDDYATMISNGAAWFIIASNRMAGNTRYIDSSGTIDIDMSVDTYLVSSYGGALTTRLPPADAAKAIGRTITIKKTDPSSNNVTVTEQGGNGPDQSTQTLSTPYDAITVLSDGGQWFVLSRYNA